ncbi:uncharacterized protein LOC144589493 [Pogona vitticeps]
MYLLICFGLFSTCSGAPCRRDLSVTLAEIILETASSLETQERLYLICTMAEYLHLDPFLLTLAPVHKRLWNLTILAEDLRYSDTTKKHYIGLYWPVGVGVFTMFYELVQVLRHNVESNNLSQLLGYEIVGWRVLKKEGNEKKHFGKHHRRHLMATPRPVLRPTKMEEFTYLSGTVLETQYFTNPSENSSPLYEATKIATPTYTDIFLHSVINEMNLQTMDTQASLHIQTKSPASNVFQFLSSELSPSLVSTTIEFMDKVVSKTPTISEHQQFQVPQAVYSTPKMSEQKHNSMLYNLVVSIPTRKTQLPMGSSQEAIPSTRPSPAGETTHIVYSGPYRLTLPVLPSQSTTSITKYSLPFMSALMDLRASPGFPFVSTAMSVLLLHGSHKTSDAFNNYKYASGAFMSSPFTTQQIEVSRWNIDFSLTYIMSTFDATAISSASAYKLGLLPDATPTVQLYCTENILSLPMYTIPDISLSLFDNFIQFGLSRTSHTPAIILSLFLSTPMGLTASFRFSNAFPTEEPLSHGTHEVTEIYTHASDAFIAASQTYRHFVTEDKIKPITMSHIDASLEKKQPHLAYVTESRSKLLGEEFAHGMKWTPDQYAYEALVLSQSAVFSTTRNKSFPTNEFGFYGNSVIKTGMIYSEVVQLDTSHLSLEESFGTKINFQMTGELISKVMEQATIFSNNKIPTETGFYATTSYHGPQDTAILMPTMYRSPQGTGEIKTPLFPLSIGKIYLNII